ncbi:MAG: 15-cis-phytoene synthase [Actinomycetota bacterium]|nr:15-cis-phytoene synthase [Actinomycetota bacterium]
MSGRGLDVARVTDTVTRGGRGRELDAAGITDPVLRTAYEEARLLNALHGRTYYLATMLLPPAKRPYVHALYAFARYADELVDDPAGPDGPGLDRFADRFLADLADGPTPGTHPVVRAAIHTARTWDIPTEHFAAFLTTMRMDLHVTEYATYADLESYMHGSAAVIGLQMLPILEPADLADPDVRSSAQALGRAFQLSNFIRDVGEDLDRGRIYLPQEDLDKFGVSRADLEHGRRTGAVDDSVRDLLQHEIARARDLYCRAEPGIDLVHPSSRHCLRTALTLYAGILEAVERSGFRVLDRRVAVPLTTRARVALPAVLRARRARRAHPPAPRPPA